MTRKKACSPMSSRLQSAASAWRNWFQAAHLPAVRTWPVRVVLVNLVQLSVVLLAGMTWERWLSSRSVFELSQHVSPLAGGMIAVLHRDLHLLLVASLASRSEFPVARLSPDSSQPAADRSHHVVLQASGRDARELDARQRAGLHHSRLVAGSRRDLHRCTALGEFFYHTNVRTPRWIGYIFQRPEMHRIHHQHARHKNNYGDIVWWDMLFGTYENPKESLLVARAASTMRASSGWATCCCIVTCTRTRRRVAQRRASKWILSG